MEKQTWMDIQQAQLLPLEFSVSSYNPGGVKTTYKIQPLREGLEEPQERILDYFEGQEVIRLKSKAEVEAWISGAMAIGTKLALQVHAERETRRLACNEL